MNRVGDFLCPLFTVRDRLLETEVTFGLHDDHYENSTWKNASVSLLNAPSKNSQHNQQSRNMKSTYRKVSVTRFQNWTASSIDGLAVSSLCNTRTLESCSQKILLVRACLRSIISQLQDKNGAAGKNRTQVHLLRTQRENKQRRNLLFRSHQNQQRNAGFRPNPQRNNNNSNNSSNTRTK
jgi:hypothetical protein